MNYQGFQPLLTSSVSACFLLSSEYHNGLEIELSARARGFESHLLRHENPPAVSDCRLFLFRFLVPIFLHFLQMVPMVP